MLVFGLWSQHDDNVTTMAFVKENLKDIVKERGEERKQETERDRE